VQQKPFNTEVFSKELDTFGIAVKRPKLFADPGLNIELESDSQSEDAEMLQH
jgi:hypothetical protein